MSGAMFHFDWGVFWAVLAAVVVAKYLPWRYSDSWINEVINKLIVIQQKQVELQERIADTADSQLEAQTRVADNFPVFK